MPTTKVAIVGTARQRSDWLFLMKPRREWQFVRKLGVAIALTLAVLQLAQGAQQAHADGLGYDGLPPQELCGLCHGLNGISATAKFPQLAGQKAIYIEKQLRDFLNRHRVNDGGQMASIVTEIKPEQFAVAAKHFQGQPVPKPDLEALSELSKQDLALARTLIATGRSADGIPACISCHGAEAPKPAYIPHLRSQHKRYLVKQLQDFKSGNRMNDRTKTMPVIAKKLSDREIEILAAYYAGQPRRGD